MHGPRGPHPFGPHRRPFWGPGPWGPPPPGGPPPPCCGRFLCCLLTLGVSEVLWFSARPPPPPPYPYNPYPPAVNPTVVVVNNREDGYVPVATDVSVNSTPISQPL